MAHKGLTKTKPPNDLEGCGSLWASTTGPRPGASNHALAMEMDFRTRIINHVASLPTHDANLARFNTSPFVVMFYACRTASPRISVARRALSANTKPWDQNTYDEERNPSCRPVVLEEPSRSIGDLTTILVAVSTIYPHRRSWRSCISLPSVPRVGKPRRGVRHEPHCRRRGARHRHRDSSAVPQACCHSTAHCGGSLLQACACDSTPVRGQRQHVAAPRHHRGAAEDRCPSDAEPSRQPRA